MTADVLAHRRTDADEAGRVVGQVGGELIDVAQDALRMPLQRLAGDRERDAAGMALEQLRADGRLEVGDAACWPRRPPTAPARRPC